MISSMWVHLQKVSHFLITAVLASW